MEMAAGVGVRGRIRARDVVASEDEATTSAATETAAAKRRKLEEEVDGESRIISSPCVELTNGGGITPRDSAELPETSMVVFGGRASSAGDQCQSPSSEDDIGGASVSCCSSNGSSDKVDGRIEFLDLDEDGGAEAETSTYYICNTRSEVSMCRDRREEWDGMDSAAAEVKASDAAESRRRRTTDKNNTKETEAEVEEFFAAAEKDLRSQIFECSKKYNFDFVKEEPLDGRYEWVKLKP